ncbi:MAG: alanine--tRNA ligase-related protein, partial [Phycisphaeraceae bacterium]|nr:alanine--tRNA ligase-related protein [Phycisphaeraceae bacterium]
STYGFPYDLTEQMAAERNLSVDVAGYEKAKQKHAENSRGAGGGDQGLQSLIEFLQKTPTDSTRFEGDTEPLLNDVRALRLLQKKDSAYEPTDRLVKDAEAAIVVDRTPFYAESGGQVGDTGRIHSSRGAVFVVTDTQKVGEVVFHLGHLEEDGLEADRPPFDDDDPLMLEIDQPRRQAIMAHHTTTHLMNWALRETLGDHVQQRGSLVDDEKTRFDFSNPKPLTDEQIAEVERLVNQRIEENLSVHAKVVDQDKALKIEGLRAVFGEKYPPRVRVVSIGPPVKKLIKKPEKKEWREYSIEFCGGTHLPQTADAVAFSIISEENVSKGTRRVIAVAGGKASRAAEHVQTLEGRIDAIGGEGPESLQQDLASCQEALQCITVPLRDRHRLLDKIAALHAELKQHRKTVGKDAEAAVVAQARQIAEKTQDDLIVADLEGADADSLRKAMDVIRSKKPDAAMLIASASAEKVAFLAAVPEPMIQRGLKAGDWVREVAKVAGGGGGGRPDMAQAGGKNPARLNDALERARAYAEEALS